MKRLWPYLLLNVAVSAVTMLIVLLIWDASHGNPAVEKEQSMAVTVSPTITPMPTNTLPAMDEELLSIGMVIGSGDLGNEYIHIVYLGGQPIDLQGWQVTDGNRVVFTFPAFMLYEGGAFDLYTKSGVNTAIGLYMNGGKALWSSGKVIKIKDPAGNTRLSYTVP